MSLWASSIADPKPNRQNRMQAQTPQPTNPSPTAIPDVRGWVPVGATGGSPSPVLGDGLPMLLRDIPSLPPSTKLEQRLALFFSPPLLSPRVQTRGTCVRPAHARPSVYSSPSPLKALRERGRGFPSVFPFRRRSIKPATSSINVQSTFNQNSNPRS